MKDITFITAVHEGKIKQPTQLGFTPEKWTHSFNAFKASDENDKRVFAAGLWFYDRLSHVRQVLDSYQLAGLDNIVFRRLFVAAANQQFAVVVHASDEDIKAHAGQTVTTGHIIERTLPIGPGGLQINLYYAIESLVSALKYPLAETYQTGKKLQRASVSDLELLAIIKARLSLANIYDVLSDLWAECLWNGWSVTTDGEIDVIHPPRSLEYESVELSQYRRDLHLLELSWQISRLWDSFSIEVKQEELNKPRIIGIERIGKKKRFKIGPLSDFSTAPSSFMMRISAEQMYWDELLVQPLPNIQPITIRDLLQIWDVLSSLGVVLEHRLREDTGAATVNSLMEFAPKIEIREIINAIIKATSMSYDRVSKAVELFSYSGSAKQDPWVTPLIPISSKECCVIIPALTVPNLIRSIENWMKEGGFDLSTRGSAFEDYIRRKVADAAKESKCFSAMKVYPTSLKINIGNENEQIDLVCFWRNTLIIAEIKCSIYPATPIEFYNYYKVLKGAADQAKRKASFVQKDLRGLLAKLGVPDSSITGIVVHPIVLSNLEIGVGVPIDGVPIVDLGILRVYFDGRQEFFVTTSKEEGKKPAYVHEYYSNEEEAENNLIDFLITPLSFSIYRKLLDVKINPIPLLSKTDASKKACYTRLFVNENKLADLIPSLKLAV